MESGLRKLLMLRRVKGRIEKTTLGEVKMEHLRVLTSLTILFL
jgi:hypothetical protein